MKEYYFLFALATIWTIFATVQDIKQREVANWLNYSLIAFALAYRAFYAVTTKNAQFFTLGLAGFAIFFGLAYAFYYTQTFAGGDAKLLMGLGIILPYESIAHLIFTQLTFLIGLFSIGAVYSLAYGFGIAIKNKKTFKQEFKKQFKKRPNLIKITTLSAIILLIYSIISNPITFLIVPLLFLPLLYAYVKALEQSMIITLPPQKLTEGDWLEKDIKINSKTTIKKTVHGISKEEIEILKKYKKNATIKQGIPFVPAFLIALILMEFFAITSKLPPASLISSLF